MKMQAKRKEETHSEWNTENVVDARPNKISADNREDRTREVKCGDDVKEVGADEDDVGGFNCDGGT